MRMDLNLFVCGFHLGFLQKSILLECETQIESLLASVFENYKSLDEGSPSGLADLFGPSPESAAPALAPAVQVYTLLHDILTLDAQTMLRNYLQVHENLCNMISLCFCKCTCKCMNTRDEFGSLWFSYPQILMT